MSRHYSVTLAMKIAADAPGSSALDAWLRNAEATDTTNGTASQVYPRSVGVPPPRDSAEALLNLDVWSGAARELATSAPSPRDSAQDPAAQGWADHIFGPLL
jgi:hypothetical protein